MSRTYKSFILGADKRIHSFGILKPDLRNTKKIVIKLLHKIDLVKADNPVRYHSFTRYISTFISSKSNITSSNRFNVVEELHVARHVPGCPTINNPMTTDSSS
ncbi:hypothetical protein HanPSC8_Chr15g0676441 [Helianthus annuus]|nr:hypothetical protein HanPSC8_Chr15g0676441 [Helianthus annuus]